MALPALMRSESWRLPPRWRALFVSLPVAGRERSVQILTREQLVVHCHYFLFCQGSMCLRDTYQVGRQNKRYSLLIGHYKEYLQFYKDLGHRTITPLPPIMIVWCRQLESHKEQSCGSIDSAYWTPPSVEEGQYIQNHNVPK